MSRRKLFVVGLALLSSFVLTVYLVSSVPALRVGAEERSVSSSTVTQSWLVMMPTTIPVSGPSLPSVLRALAPEDTVKELNELPSAVENDIIAGVLDIGAFERQGFGVSKVQVTDTHWLNSTDNKCVLVFDLTTVSDPLTAGDVLSVIIAGAATLAAILFAATAWNVGAPLWLIVLVSGALFVIALIVVLPALSSNGASAPGSPS